MLNDDGNDVVELMNLAFKDGNHLHSPVYFDGIEIFAAQSYGEILAADVAALARLLEGNQFAMTRFDVLKVDVGEVLLMKITKSEAQS